MADDDLDLDEPETSSSKKKIIFIIIGVLLLLGLAGAGTFILLSDDKEETTKTQKEGEETEETEENTDDDTEKDEDEDDDENKVKKEAIYFPLDPAFVTNFQGKSSARYLQIKVEVMTRSTEAIEAMKKHSPMIRNNLLILFSGQKAKTLRTIKGKEALRSAVLKEIQKILESELGKAEVEAVYFTSFVMQ